MASTRGSKWVIGQSTPDRWEGPSDSTCRAGAEPAPLDMRHLIDKGVANEYLTCATS
nr:hypothetical protein Itr_chr14CG16860 [Ipomoea trifida]